MNANNRLDVFDKTVNEIARWFLWLFETNALRMFTRSLFARMSLFMYRYEHHGLCFTLGKVFVYHTFFIHLLYHQLYSKPFSFMFSCGLLMCYYYLSPCLWRIHVIMKVNHLTSCGGMFQKKSKTGRFGCLTFDRSLLDSISGFRLTKRDTSWPKNVCVIPESYGMLAY